MTKKIASLQNINTISTNECLYEKIDSPVGPLEVINSYKLQQKENISVISQQLLKNLETNLTINRNLRSSSSIIYIPVVFLVANSDYDDKKNACIANAQIIVDHCNALLEGNSTGKVVGGNHSGNHGTINNNSNHLENSNVRFFLPYKIAKEQLHPFAKATGFLTSSTLISSYNSYFSKLVPGISIGDTPEQYNSQYTYDDIKAQRELVKTIADGSRSRNTDFEIGDEYKGGYIFQINEDGSGLVADLQDSGVATWGDALDAAASATFQGYDDWYLPSLEELELMYSTIGNGGSQGNIGGFDTYNFYWSSSSDNPFYKFGVNFGNGYVSSRNKGGRNRARVIRQATLISATPPEVTTLAEMEDDYFFYFGNSPGVIFFDEFNNLDGFTEGDSYQLGNIMINQLPEQAQHIPTAGLVNIPTLFASGAGGGHIMHSNFLPSIIGLKFTSQTKPHPPTTGLLGAAGLGDLLRLNKACGAIELTSLSSGKDTTEILPSYYSAPFHEFLHELGYSHGHDGVTLSGVELVGNKNLSDNWGRWQQPTLKPYNYYAGFYPPFKYYDYNNETHNLEDESTLPDYEIIDPNEKLFVESAIKTVQNIWTSIKNNPTKYIPYYNASLVEDFTIVPAPHSLKPSITYKPQLAQYAKTYGLISHLPTFWGGSYTTNEDGSKSMLINPANSLVIGDEYEGGIIFKINEDNTAFIASKEDLSTDSDGFTLSWDDSTTLAENLTLNNYTDWYLPSKDELKEMYDAIGNGSPESNIGNFQNYYYWSSSEFTSSSAWVVSFIDGDAFRSSKSSGLRVRAIRTVSLSESSGVRKGPNITVRNAVCRKDDNTKVNLRMFFTLEWYDDSFPAFPDNTKVEDMFSPNICPCLYKDQTIVYAEQNDINTFLNYTFKFFTPKIDEVTGEEINTTTGDHVWSEEGSRKLKLHYDWDSSKFSASGFTGTGANNYGSVLLFKIIFGTAGNTGNNMYEYIGAHDRAPVWIKNIGTETKPLYVPNFPIYIGFVPESPIPKNFKFAPESQSFYAVDSDAYSELEVLQKYVVVNSVNDNSLYNSWGYGFRTFVDKYFRIGNTDPSSDLYNPFKYDTTSSGEANFVFQKLQEFGYTHEEWQNYATTTHDMIANYHNPSVTNPDYANKIFAGFFKRTTASALFDSIGETMYGKLDINTLANMMYYNGDNIEPLLPSKSQMQRLNYLFEDSPVGEIKVLKEYSEDLFNNNPLYDEYLPDVNQKDTKTNTVQAYINTAMQYLDDNKIDATGAVVGCRDPLSLNYNPNAEIHSNSMCVESIAGCMNPEAPNYNSEANLDDGSCIYYSLTPKEILLIYVCPSDATSACNTNVGEKEMFVSNEKNTSTYGSLLDDYFEDVEDVDYLIETTSISNYFNYENSTIGERALGALQDTSSSYWRYPDVVNYINFFRYSGPDCSNLLASEDPDYGTLNVGGGCINIADYSMCEFPEVTKQGCQVLTDIEITSSGVSFSEEESQIMSTDNFIAYFNGLSSNPEYSVGMCNTNSNLS